MRVLACLVFALAASTAVPPPGRADEQPAWSPAGASIAYVRERNGYGRVMVRSAGHVYGPLADLGYYGHHDWGLAWRP